MFHTILLNGMFQAGDVHDYSAESMHEKMRVMRADAQPSISIDAKQPVASTPLLEKLGPLSDDDEGPSPEEARNQQEEDLEMLRAENASLREQLPSQGALLSTILARLDSLT